ncbi:MAG: hypothetical protein HY072_07060, partial [Deltaproteobacteria bacterium]|nr:hypothetical protein [Deltaproteobacteria bacterium]
QKEEIKLFLGMKITTPFKTLTDIISEGKLSIDLIREAVNQAHTRGLITQKQLNNNPKVKKYLRLKRKKHIPLQVVLEWPCSLELRS